MCVVYNRSVSRVKSCTELAGDITLTATEVAANRDDGVVGCIAICRVKHGQTGDKSPRTASTSNGI